MLTPKFIQGRFIQIACGEHLFALDTQGIVWLWSERWECWLALPQDRKAYDKNQVAQDVAPDSA
jgi:alpha-tubulin suppressor-like RCC1 family protein